MLSAPTLRTFATAPQFNVEVDYYKSLGLTRTASADEIKKKFYLLAKKHHPDAVGDCPKNEEKFKNITAAYEVIGNLDNRKQYD